MYRFVDTVPTGEPQKALLSLQTIFNGFNLDELLTDDNGRFITLSVGGRGILERRLMTRDAPYQNGLKEKGFTYDVREISVKFLIEDRTSRGLRERFNKLNAYLLGSKKKLEFTDEDAYFIATLKGGDVPDEDSNSLEGTFHFVCTDPAKRKNERTLNLTTTEQNYTITGQGKTPWDINVVFAERASKFEVDADNGLFLQLNYEFVVGDRLSISYVGRKVTLNGQDLRRAVSMNSNFVELQPGLLSIRANHGSILKYDEMFY